MNDLADCSNNMIDAFNTAKVAMVTSPGSLQLVINELLFNPATPGADFIEIYNRSSSVIDLSDLYIANRSATGLLNTPTQMSVEHQLIFPGEYSVVTEDVKTMQRQYLVKNPASCIEVSSFPSLPDDKGTVVLLSKNGLVIDELYYEEKWHFALLDNKEGISLERISADKATQDPGNWHSAASSAGYATPSYRNSQERAAVERKGLIQTEPSIFSPDNDGRDDVALLHYQFPQAGYVCNIFVYDVNGRLIRNLTRNALCGVKGQFAWDGLDENKNRLPIGLYILVTEIFNLQGQTQKFKNVITLARKF